MENEAYHRHPAISKSHLDQINRSGLHYWSAYVDPNRENREPTQAMTIGSAVHTHVLELDQWDKRYAVAPTGIDRRTKQGKDEWRVFQTAAEGRSILSWTEADQVMKMGRAVWGHRAAAELLGVDGKPEATYMWTDQATGLQCKCRPDYIFADGSTVVDLKTTEDASPRGFRGSLLRWRYWVQAAWYLHGVEQATGKRPDRFVFVAVEKKPPYGVGVYCADDAMIQRGMEQAREDLEKLAECKAADHWPSYSDDVESISLPGWMTGETTAPDLALTTEIEGF